MLRSLVIASALVAAATFAASPLAARPAAHRAARAPAHAYVAPAGSGAVFLISGHGWGHGVGMGQWGAEGYAINNYTYQQILAAYYPGTIFGQVANKPIRVLLAAGKKALTISSDQPITVTGVNGVAHTLPAGATKLTPSLSLAVDGGPAQPLEPPLTFSPATGSTLTLGRAYRGQIVVNLVGGKLQAIDIVPIEQYLYGVVPAEMSSSWLPAALEAQAVAARSYALASLRPAGPFDVYATSRSQVYLGVSAERLQTTQAVDATAGQVLLYGGRIATTVFSSSSGGRTESAADAWGGQGEPYLPSVPDPYDTISPYHDWGPVTVTGKTLARALGVPGLVVDATVTRNSSKRVADLDVTAVARGKQGTTAVTGGSAAAALDLRSTWFSVGVLSLQPPLPNRPVPYGTAVTLTGVARAAGPATVETRSRGVPWTQLTTVTPAPKTGAFSLQVTPQAMTDYRLATAADATAFVRIRVAPLVAISAASPSSISGSARPALPGATVLVQQPAVGSGKWTTVARGAVGADGSFTVAASLQPGSVRVVVAPGNGWWPGVSAAATLA